MTLLLSGAAGFAVLGLAVGRGDTDQVLLQRQQMLPHRFTGAARIMRADRLDDLAMLPVEQFARTGRAGDLARPFADIQPGPVLADPVDHVENGEEEPVAGTLGDEAMQRPVPQFMREC